MSSFLRAAFDACDFDGDGRLCAEELRPFAQQTGFEGSDTEWTSEYELLCNERGVDPQIGLDLQLMERLIDDESDSGFYCDDNDLRSIPAIAAEQKCHRRSVLSESKPNNPLRAPPGLSLLQSDDNPQQAPLNHPTRVSDKEHETQYWDKDAADDEYSNKWDTAQASSHWWRSADEWGSSSWREGACSGAAAADDDWGGEWDKHEDHSSWQQKSKDGYGGWDSSWWSSSSWEGKAARTGNHSSWKASGSSWKGSGKKA